VGRAITPLHPLAILQWVVGAGVLAIAAAFYVLVRTAPDTHYIGPPGWHLPQLARWVALALIRGVFRSLR
jgi:hypothetical protein